MPRYLKQFAACSNDPAVDVYISPIDVNRRNDPALFRGISLVDAPKRSQRTKRKLLSALCDVCGKCSNKERSPHRVPG